MVRIKDSVEASIKLNVLFGHALCLALVTCMLHALRLEVCVAGTAEPHASSGGIDLCTKLVPSGRGLQLCLLDYSAEFRGLYPGLPAAECCPEQPHVLAMFPSVCLVLGAIVCEYGTGVAHVASIFKGVHGAP